MGSTAHVHHVEDVLEDVSLVLDRSKHRQRAARQLYLMAGLTGSFMIIELVWGFITNSLALIGDAMHMMSDLLSLIIGAWAARAAAREAYVLTICNILLSEEQRNERFTFGFVRAEPVGGLINGVFLISVSLFIGFEAIQRFFDPPEVRNPDQLIIVAATGGIVNVLGLFLFHGHGHGHSHGGHGHSHGGASNYPENDFEMEIYGRLQHHTSGEHHDVSEDSDSDAEISIRNRRNDVGGSTSSATSAAGNGKKGKKKRTANANLHGVYLHVLGDFLGSVGALISGILIKSFDGEWRFYADPIASLLIVVILVANAIPLIRRTLLILLCHVPESIELGKLRKSLLAIDNVIGLHELHVWEITDAVFFCSVHCLCGAMDHVAVIQREMRDVLHSHGIHSSCIQVEHLTCTCKKE